MIEKLNSCVINDNIKSVYNFNAYSIQDLLSKFFEKINETIEVSNKALNYLDYLGNEIITSEVKKQIDAMYNDGRLTALIDSLSDELKQLITELSNRVDQNIITINNKIDNEKADVLQTLSTNINTLKQEYIANVEIDGGVW